MNKFQVIVLIIFIVLAALGAFFFATFRGGQGIEDINITIWGDLDRVAFNNFLSEFNKNTDRAFSVKYEEIKEDDFAGSVVEAIADGREPDIVLISTEQILRFEDKIFPIPFEVVSERSFRDAFIEGGEVFLSKDGILGLPFIVDPLVMYWNRDILQSSGLAGPPEFWSEFFGFSDRLTQRDDALNITRSAVALGEYQNIENAKEIILSMLFQNNNRVVARNSQGSPQVVFSGNSNQVTSSAESVLRFYTDFSNPTKTSYSWNKSLSNSLDAFTSGDLAIYFGFAGELEEIQNKNPNLNFDVASFPQPSEAESTKTYGKIKALAVLKRSKNPSVAVTVATNLIRDQHLDVLSDITNLPPVKRNLLSRPPGLAYEDLFYRSALVVESFLDPDPEQSDKIFANMINNIVSGRDRIGRATSRASSDLLDLIGN